MHSTHAVVVRHVRFRNIARSGRQLTVATDAEDFVDENGAARDMCRWSIPHVPGCPRRVTSKMTIRISQEELEILYSTLLGLVSSGGAIAAAEL